MSEENSNETTATETPVIEAGEGARAPAEATQENVVAFEAPTNEAGEGAPVKDYGEQDPVAAEGAAEGSRAPGAEEAQAGEGARAPAEALPEFRELTAEEVAELDAMAKREGMDEKKLAQLIDVVSRQLEQDLNGSIFAFRIIVINEREGGQVAVTSAGAPSASLMKLKGSKHFAQMAGGLASATVQIGLGGRA